MRKHGGRGTVSALGVLIDRLEYADDAALIDKDCATASTRLSRLNAGALEDADMAISAPKTMRYGDPKNSPPQQNSESMLVQ